MFNPNHLRLESIIFPCWLDLPRSSLMTQSNYFTYGDLIEFSLIPNSLLLLIIYTPMFFLKLHLEDCEINPPQYSQEYDWLSPDLTENNWEWYILIFLTVLITPTHIVLMTGPKFVSNYPTSTWRLTKYVYDFMFSSSVQHLDLLLDNGRIHYTEPKRSL